MCLVLVFGKLLSVIMSGMLFAVPLLWFLESPIRNVKLYFGLITDFDFQKDESKR